MVYKALTEYFEENPAVAKRNSGKGHTRQPVPVPPPKRPVKLVRRKSALESNRMPGKLADCQ